MLSRLFVEQAEKHYLLSGKPKQADVYIITFNNRKLVVKDYKNKSLFTRITGYFMLKREYSNYIYLWSRNIKFIPEPIKKIDSSAFAIEFIEGPTMGDIENREDFAFVSELLKNQIEILHANRFFHLDLRKRGNMIIRGKSLFLIDFASSLRFSKYNPLLYVLKPLMKYVDNSSVLKWKRFVWARSLTPKDIKHLKRFERTRFLWFLNKPRIGDTKIKDHSDGE